MTTFQSFALDAAQIILALISGGGALFSFFQMFEAKTRADRSQAITYFIALTVFTGWLIKDMGGW